MNEWKSYRNIVLILYKKLGKISNNCYLIIIYKRRHNLIELWVSFEVSHFSIIQIKIKNIMNKI
jgi:hypothetical protein